MPMNPRLLRPTSSSFHPEALDWRTRVIANGGSVSASTMRAVSQFCASINATSGLRGAILRLNLFCGNSDASLNAVRTPLYLSGSLGGAAIGNATDTNVNFAEADYAETGASGGLKGNGTTKYLNTGFNSSSLASANSTHLSASGTSMETSGDVMLLGSYLFPGDAGFTQLFLLDAYSAGNGGRGFRSGGIGGTGVFASSPGTAESHIIGTRTASSAAVLYRGGVSAATSSTTGNAATAARPTLVFGAMNGTTPGNYSAARLRMYSIGNGLTAAQALAFSNAVIAFNTALGRA